MQTMFYLSTDHIKLASAEVIALTKAKDYRLDDRILIINTQKKGLHKRLAYTHHIYKLLFSCKKNMLVKNIERFNWNSIYKDDFCIRTINSENILSESRIADLVWIRLKNPKTNLFNPKTKIEFIFTKDSVYCGILVGETDKSYNLRKAHNRKVPQPYSLNPKLARAMVNLTEIQKGKIVDPFCGTGGILIEAGLMGLKPVGYDINPWMIKASEKNLKQFKIKNYILKQKDATKLKERISYVVTDLPYSRNTKKANLEDLYFNFLKKLETLKTKTAVIGFPDFIDYKKKIKKTKLKIKNEFTYYLHKSLSKKIVVLKSH